MLHPNDTLGPYTLVRELGRGQFAVVWLAERRDRFGATPFALKIPLDPNPSLTDIQEEVQHWRQASGHPNVLPIIEADVFNDYVVIVSEYAPDGSLEAWLRRHQGVEVGLEVIVDITEGILDGLAHLHARKIIHRDLKPANILMQGEKPRLADFGISRVLKTSSHSSTIAGTPYYMAPETFRGIRNVQTDLWSAGVILYQLLVGGLPFFHDDFYALIEQIRTQPPKELPLMLPSALREVVLRSLAKDASVRYASAQQMRKEVRLAFQSASRASDNNVQAEKTSILGSKDVDEAAHTESRRDSEQSAAANREWRGGPAPISRDPKPKRRVLYICALALTGLLAAAGVARYALYPTPSRNANAPPPRTLYRVINIALIDSLKVRSGPGPDYSAVGSIPPDGRDVQLTGDSKRAPDGGTWFPVKYQRLEGWVNARYLVAQ